VSAAAEATHLPGAPADDDNRRTSSTPPGSATTSDTATLRGTQVWRPKPSAGGRLGLALSGAGAAIGLAGLALGVLSTPGLVALLLMAFGLCAVVAAAIIALWTYGYFDLRYILTPAALVIRWLGGDEAVPLADLQGVYSGQRLGKLPRLRGFTWHGYWVGRALHRDVDLACYATSLEPADLTLLVTSRVSYAVSPEDVVGFRQELIRRAEAGLDDPPGARTGRLAGAALALLDPLSLALMAGGLFLALLVLSRYMLGIGGLPEQAALHFAADGSADLVGPRAQLAALPVLAIGGWLVSAVGGLLLAGQERGAARLIWLGNLAAGAILLVAALRLLP